MGFSKEFWKAMPATDKAEYNRLRREKYKRLGSLYQIPTYRPHPAQLQVLLLALQKISSRA